MATPDPAVPIHRIRMPAGKLLVRRLKPEETTAGGLALPAAAQVHKCIAEVIAGPAKTDEGCPAVIGDQVLANRHVFTAGSVSDLAEDLHVISAGDVLLILKPEAVKP